MLKLSESFNSFSVNDLQAAKKFYSETLGITVTEEKDMGLKMQFPSGGVTFIYEKEDHEPATFTILNFPTDNIEESVEELKGKGVKFEELSLGDAKTDEMGIMRGKEHDMGPNMAWFKDPAGNWLAIMEE